jgi:hypothetical protein
LSLKLQILPIELQSIQEEYFNFNQQNIELMKQIYYNYDFLIQHLESILMIENENISFRGELVNLQEELIKKKRKLVQI